MLYLATNHLMILETTFRVHRNNFQTYWYILGDTTGMIKIANRNIKE